MEYCGCLFDEGYVCTGLGGCCEYVHIVFYAKSWMFWECFSYFSFFSDKQDGPVEPILQPPM
jgi:hypothetical protein